MIKQPSFSSKEHIFRTEDEEGVARIAVGVALRTFVSARCGALSLSTAVASFVPGAFLPLHRHPAGEAITVIEGEALLQVEGRRYRMAPLDCAFIPAGTAHSVRNAERGRDLLVHSAFGVPQVTRELLTRDYRVEERGWESPAVKDPEKMIRFAEAAVYELAPGAHFTDLFARRLGAVGICGGYGRFAPGASLPCHLHDFDESITIVEGTARCQVQGRQYELSECATAYIPEGIPHRFLNYGQKEMAMIWVYAGAEPDRRLLEAGFCSGALAWPGPYLVQ